MKRRGSLEWRFCNLRAPKRRRKIRKTRKCKVTSRKKSEPKTPKPPASREQTEDGIEDDEPNVQADVDMINMKLTPGTGRRGKAARTAVTIFLKDRGITPEGKGFVEGRQGRTTR
ncbi:hypothetical protein NQ318_014893 [Aromia moschata]|uniref:Uncharacterized protein n=1 Tax=Aromia moschata TaxID=1265417 RepID=A0AAV8YTG6_9CUCU|nr:hypothetical protein NQ318_014893 [Aromia moschata]